MPRGVPNKAVNPEEVTPDVVVTPAEEVEELELEVITTVTDEVEVEVKAEEEEEAPAEEEKKASSEDQEDTASTKDKAEDETEEDVLVLKVITPVYKTALSKTHTRNAVGTVYIIDGLVNGRIRISEYQDRHNVLGWIALEER